MIRALAMGVIALCLGCGAGDGGGPDEPDPVDDVCGPDIPLVSWQTFGEGFTATYCQGCHATTTLDRQGAPDEIFFDSEQDTLDIAQLVLASTTGEAPRMPPNGGPTEDDRELLSIWLTCFAE